MRVFSYLLILFLSFGSTLTAQHVKWTNWEKATQSHSVTPKKILVYLYTDWCKLCKDMENVTFQDPNLASFVNNNMHAIKFNAENSETIRFKGKTYNKENSTNQRFNKLAMELTNGEMVFPTLVFLDENLNVIQSLQGYQGPKRLRKISNYFSKNIYLQQPWKEYSKLYDYAQNNFH